MLKLYCSLREKDLYFNFRVIKKHIGRKVTSLALIQLVRVCFSVGGFPSVVRKSQEIYATFGPGYHLAIAIIQKTILHLPTDGLASDAVHGHN